MSKKRTIDENTPTAETFDCGSGRWALNCPKGVAPTLTTAHHFSGNITHPRQGFREIGVLVQYGETIKF